MKILNILTVMNSFYKLNFFHTMNIFKNMAKITICGFALVGLIACSSGGSGGSSTSNTGTELVISNPSSVDVPENTTEVLVLEATGGNGDAVTYTLGTGNDEDLFVITGNVLSFKTAPDFENPDCSDNICTVSIIVSDGVNSTTQTITITVADVNSPQFTSTDNVSVPENTTDVIIITATDDDGDTVTYTLGSGNDASLFDLSADVLSFKTAPDYESPACGNASNTCILSIVASDGINNTTQTITITVANAIANESPQFTSADNASTAENTTAVLSLNATDDDGDAVTYTLGDTNDANLFTINGNDLSFNTAPDYESPACSDNSCSISIIASDGVNSTTQTITITVTNANDNSPQITSADNVNILENTVFVIAATDDDGDTIIYTLGDTNDANLFTINGDVLSFNTAPDYEAPACSDNSCSISIIASDGVFTDTQTITITVVADSDGDGIPNSIDDDADNDGELDITDVDDDNDGLIEIHSLDMLHHIRYNLAGTNYKSTSGGSADTTGAPSAVTTTCSDAGKSTNLCGYELSRNLDFDSSSSYAVNSTNFVIAGDSTSTSFNANNSVRTSATNVGWEPIGINSGSAAFTGVFDGNHFTITNLYISTQARFVVGLFGYIDGATIRNVGVTEIYISHAYRGVFYAGGLVGGVQNTLIENSYTAGTITGTASDLNLPVYIGGLVGYYQTGSSEIRHSYSAVNINTNYSFSLLGILGIGGLVGGSQTSLDISNSYATGNVTAAAGYVAGFIGRVSNTNGNTNVNTSYSTGVATNISSSGGAFVANHNNASFTDNFYDSEIDHAIGGDEVTQPSGVSGLTTTQMQAACTAEDITNETDICALGNAFQYSSSSYPKLYRLNPDDTISTTLLGGQD